MRRLQLLFASAALVILLPGAPSDAQVGGGSCSLLNGTYVGSSTGTLATNRNLLGFSRLNLTNGSGTGRSVVSNYTDKYAATHTQLKVTCLAQGAQTILSFESLQPKAGDSTTMGTTWGGAGNLIVTVLDGGKRATTSNQESAGVMVKI